MLITYSQAQSSQDCGIGCIECVDSSYNQKECTKCEQDFILQHNQCVYTLCQSFTYLVYDQSQKKQNPSQCQALCPDNFQEDENLKVCSKINQCSISFSQNQTINRLNNGGNIENIFEVSQSITMIVYETYQTLINSSTGSYMYDIIDSNIVKVIQRYPYFILLTADNQLVFWDFTNNRKESLFKVSQGRLSKKSQLVYVSELDTREGLIGVVTSFDEWLNLIYFTAFNSEFTPADVLQQTPSLSLENSYIYVLDGFIIQVNINQHISIYSFVVDLSTSTFSIQKRLCEKLSDLLVPYYPILQAIQILENNNSPPVNLLIIQEKSMNLIQLTDSSDGYSFPSLDYQNIEFEDFPQELSSINKMQDENYTVFSVRFDSQIQFYNQTLEKLLTFEQPGISGFAFNRDESLDFYQAKMFVLYSKQSMVTSHIIKYEDRQIIDKSQIKTQIQNPDSFKTSFVKYIIGGIQKEHIYNKQIQTRNLFGLDAFIVYVVGKNVQRIDVDSDRTSYVMNPFAQKKWIQNQLINQMAFSQTYQILLTCSNDGTIIAWNLIQALNPDFLYKVQKQQQKCRNIEIHNDQWVLALFSNQILIFNLRNQYQYSEFNFTHVDDQQQFITHSTDYILLYFDQNFQILNGVTLQLVSQNNQLMRNSNIQKVFFLNNMEILTQNNQDQLNLILLSSQLEFPTQITFSYKSQNSQITLLKVDRNINTQFEIMIGLSNDKFLILSNELQIIFSHVLQQGFPFEVKKYSDNNQYILYGQNTNQDAAYQNFHYLLQRDVNQGNIIGKSYSLKLNLEIKKVTDFNGNNHINYLSTSPQSIYTIILRNRYLQDIQTLEFSNYVFSYGSGIAKYVNYDSGNVQYYSGIDGKLSFDTNNWNSVLQIKVNPPNILEPISNIKTSFKLGFLFILQNELNIYNLFTNQFITQIQFDQELSSQHVKQLFILENYNIIFCFKPQQVVMQNFDSKKSASYLSQGNINGIIINEDDKLVYIYGSQLAIATFELIIQKIIFDGQQQRYQLTFCLIASNQLICKTNNQQILIFNMQQQYLFNRIPVKSMSQDFILLFDSKYSQIIIASQKIMQVYDFNGNLQNSYNNFINSVKDIQILGDNLSVLAQTRTLQFNQQITPNGGGNLLGQYYIKEYNLLVYYTDNIRYAQLFYFNLLTFSDNGYSTSPYTEIGYGVVVQLFYDHLTQRLNYIDSLGYLYSISLSSQKALFNLLPFDAFKQQIGKPTNYYVDYNVNNLYIYNSQGIFFINYNIISKYVVQQNSLSQKYHIKFLQENESPSNTQYYIFDSLSTLYTYSNFVSAYLDYFDEEIIDVKQLKEYQLIVLVFSHKILIYTYEQAQSQSIFSDSYVGLIDNPKVAQFISDELYISTENKLIHINYNFYKENSVDWQFKTIQLPSSEQIIHFVKLDNEDKEILISFKSGSIIIYDQILKSVNNILNENNQFGQANQLSMSEDFIFLVFSNGSINKVSRQNYSVFQTYNMQQILETQQSKFCDIKIDSHYGQIFLNFCYTKQLYVLDLNTFELIKYLSFPNDQHNRISFCVEFIFAYSWSQVNIFKRGTLEFLNKIRKNNSIDRIHTLQVISEKILIITYNQMLEIYLFSQYKILLIDQQTATDPRVVDGYLSDINNSILTIICVSDLTVIEKKINLNLFDISTALSNYDKNQISTLIPTPYSCFYKIDINNQSVGQSVFQNIYNSLQNYRIAATLRGEPKELSFIPTSSVDLIFQPSEDSPQKQYITIGNETFTKFEFKNNNIKDMQLNFGWFEHITVFSKFTKNVKWQNVNLFDINYGLLQVQFKNMDNIAISDFNITLINFNENYFETKKDNYSKERQILFYFQNCTNVVIDKLTINKYTSYWRSTLFGFENVQNISITNLKVTDSSFYGLFDFKNCQNLKIQTVNITNNQVNLRIPYSPLNDIDQDQSKQQTERYVFTILGNLNTVMDSIFFQSNKDLLIMRYSNTYQHSNETTTLFNDQLSLQNIHIEYSEISKNQSLYLQQMSNQPLIVIQSSNASIVSSVFQHNQGNIQIVETNLLSISKSYFKNNTSIDGGAMYLQQINKFKLKNCTFINNTAQGSGGGIYMDTINSFQFDQNKIFFNQADIGGGIRLINFENQTFYSSQILNNTAYVFGNDVGISPNQLNIIYDKSFLFQNEKTFSLRYHLDKDHTDPIQISQFRSGDLLPLQIQFLDQDSKILSFSKTKLQSQLYSQGVYDDIMSLQIYIISTNIKQILAIGQTNINYNQFNEQNKTFDIQSLQIDSIPKQTQSITLIVTTNSNQKKTQMNILVEIQFRECIIGEIKKQISGEIIICDQCTNGYYSLSNPDDPKTMQCQKCPIQAQECQGNKIILKDGYWRESQISDLIFECDSTQQVVSCQEKNPESRKGCIQGYIGPLCEQCDMAQELWGSRYTFNNSRQVCQECNNWVVYYVTFAFLTLIFFVYIILSVCLFMNNFIFHSKSTYLRFLQILPIYSSCIKDQSTFYMKSIINFLQLSSILLEPSFQKRTPAFITWPDSFGNPINNVLSFSNCIFFERANTSYQVTQTKIILEGFYPLIFLVLTSLIFYILARYKLFGIKTYHNYATLTILFTFFQPELVRFYTNALSCRSIGNQKYQTINLQIKCNEDSYMAFSYLFIIPYIVILLTLPLFFLVKIFKNRQKLFYCVNKYKYGYFYLDYRDGFYFWEFIRIYMKTFIVLFYTLYKEQDMYYCYQIITLFICLYAVLNHVFRPYLQRKVFWLETSSMVILVVCILLQQLHLKYNSLTPLTILFGLYMAFILVVLVIIIYLKMIVVYQMVLKDLNTLKTIKNTYQKKLNSNINTFTLEKDKKINVSHHIIIGLQDSLKL